MARQDAPEHRRALDFNQLKLSASNNRSSSTKEFKQNAENIVSQIVEGPFNYETKQFLDNWNDLKKERVKRQKMHLLQLKN